MSLCHFVYHKSHTDWPGIEPSPRRWKAGYQPTETWHGYIEYMWSFSLIRDRLTMRIELILIGVMKKAFRQDNKLFITVSS